ncbi:MAG: pentapeptide repeat-containing protein, partial [Myxococcota bacterium]
MRNNNVKKGKNLFVGLLLTLGQLVAVHAYSMEGMEDTKGDDAEESAIGGRLYSRQLQHGYTVMLKEKEGGVAMWRWKGSVTKSVFPVPRPSSMTSVACNPTEKIIAVGNSIGTVTAYDCVNWDSLHTTPLHKESISQVVFEPEGQLAASSSSDKTVKLWDPKTGKELKTLEHKAAVQSLVFNPHQSEYLTTVSADGVVSRWDLEDVQSPQPEIGFELGGNSQEQANSVAIGPKGKLLAVASQDGKLRYWNATANRKNARFTVSAHTGAINALAFSSQSTLASSGNDTVVKLWDSQQPETALITLQAHNKTLRTVAFNPTGTIVASAGEDATIRLWDVKSGKQIKELDGHTAGTTSLEFIAQGKLLLSVGHDDALRVWEVSSGRELDVFKDKEGWELSYRGQYLALEVDEQMEQRILIQELQGRNTQLQEQVEQLKKEKEDEYENLHLRHFEQDAKQVQELVDRVKQDTDLKTKLWWLVDYSKFNPQAALIAANALTVLNTAGESFVGKDLRGIHASVHAADDSNQTPWQGPDLRGADLRQTDFANADLRGADLTNVTFRLQVDHKDLAGHTSVVYGVSFSSDGQRVASSSYDSTVRIWNAISGQQLHQLKGHMNSVYSVTFSPKDKLVASGSVDNTVRIWNATNGQQLQQFNGHTHYIISVAFSPDGRLLVSGGGDNMVRIWNINNGQQLRQLKGHTQYVHSVAFSPDGQQVVSGSGDNTVRIWNATSGQQLYQLKGHTNSVNSVRFSPNNQHVVSLGHDGTVRLWDVTSGQQLRQFPGSGDGAWLEHLSFCADGRYLAGPACGN